VLPGVAIFARDLTIGTANTKLYPEWGAKEPRH
jgi:hypothetical protein